MIAGVPYDAEVEYLESTGTQWIDTGVVPTIYTGTSLVFQTLITTGDESNAFFGSRLGALNSALSAMQGYYTSLRIRWDYGANLGWAAGIESGVHSIITSGNKLKYDGYSEAVVGGFSPSGMAIWLFAINNNGSALVPHKGLRVFAFQIYDGNTLVRDFIPVRVGTVGYMYDRVSRKLFGNKGTGAFTIGPDVAKPVMGVWRYA